MSLKVGELFATLNLDDSAFTRGLSKAGSLFGKGMKGMAAASASLATAAVAAGTVAVKSIIEAGSNFEAAMSEVQAISGATGEELEKLTETAKHYGATTAFTASQAAEALKYMALAGWDAEESTAALPGVLNLAAASGMDLAMASDMVTDYISAFGMECSDATYLSDLMAKAQATSNTSAQQLGEAYGNCAATLHAAGQDVETTTSLLMTMANQGLKGSEAGTALSAMIRDITQKMKNGSIAIGKTNVSVQDAEGNFRDLTDILADIQTATEGMGTAEKSAALMTTFTARSIKGVNLVLNEGVQAAADYETSLRGAAGTGTEQAEIMLDNLQGDVKLFQSALEGLQIDAYDSMNGMMRDAVQGATSVITQLQAAFNAGFTTTSLEGVLDSLFNLLGNVGGQISDIIVGISDAFANIVPRLAKDLAKGLGDVMKKVGKQMPKLAKNLFSALPDLLRTAGDLIPSLADSLFEAVSAALEQVISDLPELVPALIEGLGNLFESAVKGVGNLMEGIFEGIWNAIGKMGLRDLTFTEALQKQIDNADTSEVDKTIDGGLLTYQFDVTVDPGEYQQKINEAVRNIHNALLGVPELSADERTAIEEALLSGSGADTLEAVIASLDVPDPEGVTTKITTAFETISSTLSTLGLSEDAQAKIMEVADNGGSVAEALMAYGVDPETAATVGADIEAQWSTLDTTLTGLGLDSGTIMTLMTTCQGDRLAIITALKLLGLDEATINSILESYDVAAGTLSGQFAGVIASIGDALTNGIPDDPETDPDLKAAKTKLEDYIAAAYAKLEEWRDAKLKELEESGLEGDALQAEVDNVNATFNNLAGDLENLTASTVTWIDENSGKATSVVQQHMGELDEIANRADTLNARIDALGASLSKGYALERTGVENGKITSQKSQIEAVNYTAQEYENAVQQAEEKRQQAIEKATTTAEQNAANAEYEAAVAKAAEIQQQHLDRIWTGIIASNPDLANNPELQKFAESFKNIPFASKIQEAINESIASGEPVSGQEIIDSLNITPAEVSNLEEALGLEPGSLAQAIDEAIQNGLSGGFGGPDLFTTLGQYIQSNLGNTDFAKLLESGDIDFSGLAAVIQGALEAGLITLPEGVDINQYIQDILSNLTWDENGNLVIPPLTLTPSDPPVKQESGQNLASSASESVQEQLDGAETDPVTVEEPVEVEPTVTSPEETKQETTKAIEEATGTAEETTPDTKTVDMTMDLNASVGNITFSEGNSVTDKLQALFTAQTVSMPVDITITKGTITVPEGTFTTADVQTALSNVYTTAIPLSVDASLTINVTSSNATSLGENAGGEIAAGIASGITAGESAGTAQQAAYSLAQAAAHRAGDAVTTAWQSGYNLAAGVASGISAGKSAAVNAAIELAKAAVQAVNQTLDNGSPSRVMMESGKWFDEGFASGIIRSAGSAVRSASSLASMAADAATVGPLSPGVSYGGSGGSGSASQVIDYDALAEAMDNRQIIMTMDNRQVAEIQQRETARAQTLRNRRVALGRGMR